VQNYYLENNPDKIDIYKSAHPVMQNYKSDSNDSRDADQSLSNINNNIIVDDWTQNSINFENGVKAD